MMVGTISKNYNFGLTKLEKWMSCLTPLSGRPNVMVSCSARVATPRDHMTYYRSFSLWILCAPEGRPLLGGHVDALNHDRGS